MATLAHTSGTEIISSIATSTYELIFFNPNSTILEGQLRFSLLDGQKVVDYALEINNIYRHASVVPKSIGKQAYENTIRRRIDPALLEKTIGNNFSTRLFYMDQIWTGLSVRSNQSLALSVGTNSDKIQFAYSFDHYFGEISQYQIGTHEVTMSIMIPNRVKNY